MYFILHGTEDPLEHEGYAFSYTLDLHQSIMSREFYTLYVDMGCDPPMTIYVEFELLVNSHNERVYTQCLRLWNTLQHGAKEVREQNKGLI